MADAREYDDADEPQTRPGCRQCLRRDLGHERARRVLRLASRVWLSQKSHTDQSDGVNISLPLPDRSPDDFKPWPHVDQSPLTTSFHCLQGIMNILPNGPEDGGLMVSLRSQYQADALGAGGIAGFVHGIVGGIRASEARRRMEQARPTRSHPRASSVVD